MKFVKNVFRVNHNQNQIHHINIHKSTHKIESEADAHIKRNVIFTVLDNIHDISSDPPPSDPFLSKKLVNFDEIILAIITERIITATAKIRFNKVSVEKNFVNADVFCFACSIFSSDKANEVGI